MTRERGPIAKLTDALKLKALSEERSLDVRRENGLASRVDQELGLTT